MRTPRTASLLAALLGLLALAPAAFGQTALDQYQRTGQINPCTLTGGAGDIPNDVAQYAPDFLDAYRAAQRAGCRRPDISSTKPTETTAGVPVDGGGAPLPPGTTFVPKPPAPPRVSGGVGRPVRHLPLSVRSDTRAPLPVIALGALLLLLIAGGALAATWRYMGWGLGGRLDPARHAAGEARLRFAGLGDRLRALVRRGA
jgi:hypothetical protein